MPSLCRRLLAYGLALGVPVFAAAGAARAQLGPVPGIAPATLNQPNGPAQLDATGAASAFKVMPSVGSTARSLSAMASDRLNIKNFGAKGDAQSQSLNVTVTSGSNILSVAGAAGTTAKNIGSGIFFPTDVGKLIDIPTAGASNAILTTTIASYVSPTSVTLTNAAGTTVGGTAQIVTWGTDDGAALGAAEAVVNSASVAGNRPCVYLPAGKYLIKTAPPGFAQNVPGCVLGDGLMHSFLIADAAFSGDLLSWSEAWSAANPLLGAYITSNWNGVRIEGLTLTGYNGAAAQQNGIMLYDRTDFAIIRDVDIMFFNGYAFAAGVVKNVQHAYFRESKMYNVRVWHSGTATLPAVLFTTQNTNSSPDDGTNEISIYGMDILGSVGVGLKVSNSSMVSQTRLMRFFGLRVENAGGDLIQIGGASTDPDNQAVGTVRMDGLEENTPQAGFCALKTQGAVASSPNGTRVSGEIGPGAGNGLCIMSGSNQEFHMASIATTGTDLTVGTSTAVQGPTFIDGNGQEIGWSTIIDATSVPLVRLPAYNYGTPGGATAVLGQPHDASAGRGNTIPAGSVDLQTVKSNAAQVASGANAVLLGGQSNAAEGANSVVVGGSGNVNTGFLGFIGSGATNTIGGGQGGVIAGGQNNTTNGTYAMVPGGFYAIDHGRYGWNGWASGRIANQGDAQTGAQLLRSFTTTAVGMRLTSDMAAASGANTINIVASAHFHTAVSASCRDITATGWASWDALPGDLDRGATGNATYSGGYATAAAPTRSAGTLTGITLTLAADSTNQGLAATVTSPSGNTDMIHCVARVETREEIQ